MTIIMLEFAGMATASSSQSIGYTFGGGARLFYCFSCPHGGLLGAVSDPLDWLDGVDCRN